jgi:type II secretory pathway pseudopilin PulG
MIHTAHPTSRLAAGLARRSSRRAFTLVELMISIAIAIILIAGVNVVFKYTTDAVGTGQALNTATRDSRAAQAVFANDFANFVANGAGSNAAPFTIINCTAVPAFKNHQTELAFNATGTNASIPRELQVDINGNGMFGETGVPGEIVSPVTYNNANHRTDTISFFARGLFPRQTGNDGTYVANMSSQEAMIWYGHLSLPDNASPPFYWTAGSGTSVTQNPNNYYASQFLLGRMAILLRMPGPPPNNPAGPSSIYDNQSNQQDYINNTNGPWSPLAMGNLATNTPTAINNPSNKPFKIENSRFDVAIGSISQLHSALLAYITPPGGTNTPPWGTNMVYQFQANPFLVKPLTSQQMAQTSPVMLQGCSQFMVEFAGDFVTQNNNPNATASTGTDPNATGTYGDVTARGADGVVDFVVDKTADTSPGKINPSLWRRQIRWYGLPRDSNGSGTVFGYKSGRSNNDMLGVVPVRDVVLTTVNPSVLPGGYTNESFESFSTIPLNNNSLPLPSATGDYQKDMDPTKDNSGNYPTYTVYLGPNDPRIKMIRITITLDDPNGRLADGQTYQYVYALP